MWTWKVFLVLALIATISTVYTEFHNEKFQDGNESLPLFLRSLRQIHREPPPPPSVTRATIVSEWIDQKLDHFDEEETRTWKMRYMVNDEHFEEGGPMFIVFGGEWEITPGHISGGHFYDMAKEHNAMLFYTEHRYYGQSKPTSDLTLDNLKYLHVKQALADLAHFIRHLKETVPALAHAKVIIAGGSYSASMVVWFKRLYPELVDGGWASSAPILAKVDFREYAEVSGQAMRELGSQQCHDRIKNGIFELESMFANRRGAEVKAMMKLCNNFDEYNDLDRWILFAFISNSFGSLVQYQNEGDIPLLCDYLMQFDDDATAIAGFLLTFSGTGCIDLHYKKVLEYMTDTSFVLGVLRQWFYQTCNEFGWFQSSGSQNQPFGSNFPVTLYTTLCADTFGKKYGNEYINSSATQTNMDFGGMNPGVDRIHMSHGALDPWNPMGHGIEQGATMIPKASHCKDLYSISSDDSKEMAQAKERVADLVRDWLKN